MADVQIKTFKNGPYEVKGPIQLIDPQGADFKLEKDRIFLCRCGQSANKPFCDGAHARAGFKSEEPAR